MLEALLASALKEKVLLFLLANPESYPREIARNFAFNLNAVQYQLEKMEGSGILCSRLRGKVRLYSLNPRYPFLKELKLLLQKALDCMNAPEKHRLYIRRRRPRLAGKPL